MADVSTAVTLRLNDADARYLPLLKEGAVEAVLMAAPDAGFRRSCEAAGIAVLPLDSVQILGWKDLAVAPRGKRIALKDGVWPGLGRSNEIVVASASRKPWINANGYAAALLRTLYPGRPALLAHVPDKAPLEVLKGRSSYQSLELALIEARVCGGDYLLALEANYSKALLAGDGRVLESWRRLGQTARWLKANAKLFQGSANPVFTVLIEPTEESSELANLLYRHGASPAFSKGIIESGAATIAAAGIQTPAPEARERILQLVERGCTLIADNENARAWWRKPAMRLQREQPDRRFYAFGRGRIVGYRRPMADPSEFAADCIDLITPARRALRLWYANTCIGTVSAGPERGSAVVSVVNYGSPLDRDAMAHVLGSFRTAELIRPEGGPIKLKPIQRGPLTEVMIPELNRVAVIVLS